MDTIYIQEIQSFKWLGIVPGIIALAFAVIWFFQAVLHKPVGNKPAPNWMFVVLFIPIAALAIVLSLQRLTTTISNRGVTMSFGIFAAKRVLPLDNIKSIKVRRYNGISEFSGWGVKGNANERCYTVSGDEGIEIEFKNGDKKILIGTHEAAQMRAVINKYLAAIP